MGTLLLEIGNYRDAPGNLQRKKSVPAKGALGENRPRGQAICLKQVEARSGSWLAASGLSACTRVNSRPYAFGGPSFNTSESAVLNLVISS